MTNNTKMIQTDPETINLLSKIKGWHLLRENKTSYTDIVKNLVLKDAKKKGLTNNYQPGGNRDKIEGDEESKKQ